MHKKYGWSLSQGFTIVELLVVIVVIGILASVVIVGYSGFSSRARDNVLKSSLATIAQGLKAYGAQDSAENYPATLQDANVNTSADIQYQYSVDNSASPKTFCVTATQEGVSYYYSSINSQVLSGSCPGHGFQTAAGWTAYPIPWSTSTTDHGYGLYYGAYYPSTLHADNSGSLTLFNPLAPIASQGGVNTYFWCRNTTSNVISSTVTGTAFATFNATNPTNTITWSCSAGSVLYAFHIGVSNPGNNPDGFTGSVKNRTWYAPQSPNYVASQPYTLPSITADPEGWVTMPIPWSTGTDLGYGPYYGVYIANDPAKDLSAVQTNTFQLYNPYSNTRAQGGVVFYYWCKNDTTGLVGNYSTVTFATFNATQTQQVTWTCPVGSKLFAGSISSTMTATMYPNEIAPSGKTRFWFSGEKVQAKQSYIESIRVLYGE